MSTITQISIPVKPHIAKYITAIYGSPIKVGFSTMPGKIVYACLQKKPQNYNVKADDYVQKKLSALKASITFIINRSQVLYPGKFITHHKKRLLNDILEDYFYMHLANYCKINRQQGIKVEVALKDFCKQHNITINKDITIDALRKSEQRCNIKK